MLRSVEDLHIIFQLALVQALNCTYGIHPNGREVANEYRGYLVSQNFFYRTFFMVEPAEQATGLRVWALAPAPES